MLFLVTPDGDDVGIVNQNIRRHQDRIGEQAVIGGKAAGDLVLVTGAALQQAHGRDGGQHPRQFRDFRHVGLAEQQRLARVQAAGQEIQRHVQCSAASFGGVHQGGHGMVISDEVKRLALLLQFDGGLHHAEIIPQVQRARGLNAG